MLGKISMYIFIFSKNKVSIYIKLFATKNLLDLGLFLRKIHKISNQRAGKLNGTNSIHQNLIT